MPAEDMMEFEGIVVQAKGNGMFAVQPDNMENILLCTLSGKIRKNAIRILEHDRVKVEVSPYDLTRGRITYRMKV